MKILYLTHQFFPRSVGGTETYTLGLARAVRAAGHESSILTYHESPSGNSADYGAFPAPFPVLPVTEIHYNLSIAPDRVAYEYNNPVIKELVLEEFDKGKPDLVHAMHTMKLSGAALEAAYELGIPVVLTLCDFWFLCPRHTLMKWDSRLCDGPDHPFACLRCLRHLHGAFAEVDIDASDDLLYAKMQSVMDRDRKSDRVLRGELTSLVNRKRTLKALAGRASRIIALSHFQKRMFAANGYDEGAIDVVSHGLDVTGIRPKEGEPHHPLRLLYVGSLVEHKGVHVLLAAVRELPSLEIELHVYGALQPETPYVRNLRRIAGDDRRIRFMGNFEIGEFGAILAENDVLALPAIWYENDPLVVKAAMYAGLPVLVSRIGSLEEMVDSRSGRLVEAGDVSSWTKALRQISADVSRPQPAPKRVKTLEENSLEMLRLYEETAGFAE